MGRFEETRKRLEKEKIKRKEIVKKKQEKLIIEISNLLGFVMTLGTSSLGFFIMFNEVYANLAVSFVFSVVWAFIFIALIFTNKL